MMKPERALLWQREVKKGSGEKMEGGGVVESTDLLHFLFIILLVSSQSLLVKEFKVLIL